MDEQFLADEWAKSRSRSRQMLPVAATMFAALVAVVSFAGLYRSDSAFLVGVLVGSLGYWVILEALTIVRVGRLLRAARAETKSAP